MYLFNSFKEQEIHELLMLVLIFVKTIIIVQIHITIYELHIIDIGYTIYI